MPGYGVDTDAAGLLPWSWAVSRLTASRHYWVATAWPDGRPHVTPVWGAWHDDAVWFSCGAASRKALNLSADPRCTVTTADPAEPVLCEGVAERRSAPADAETFAGLTNAKYDVTYDAAFYAVNALYRLAPTRVVGLVESDFTATPTRWLPGP